MVAQCSASCRRHCGKRKRPRTNAIIFDWLLIRCWCELTEKLFLLRPATEPSGPLSYEIFTGFRTVILYLIRWRGWAFPLRKSMWSLTRTCILITRAEILAL